MPNYRYDELREQFKEFFKSSKDKSSKIAWQFCEKYMLTEKATKKGPARMTVYRWRSEMSKAIHKD